MHVLLGFQEVSNQPLGSEKIIESLDVRFDADFFSEASHFACFALAACIFIYTYRYICTLHINFIVNMNELAIQLYNCNGNVGVKTQDLLRMLQKLLDFGLAKMLQDEGHVKLSKGKPP